MQGFHIDHEHLCILFCKMIRLRGQNLGRNAARGKAHPRVQRTGKIICKNQQAKHVSSSPPLSTMYMFIMRTLRSYCTQKRKKSVSI